MLQIVHSKLNIFFSNQSFSTTIRVSNNFDPDQAQLFVFDLILYASVNSYGHDEELSSHTYFYLSKLDEAVNQYFVHILSLVTDKNPRIGSRRRITVEIISWSISMKVWEWVVIELGTPGSAVRHITNCATRFGMTFLTPRLDVLSGLIWM